MIWTPLARTCGTLTHTQVHIPSCVCSGREGSGGHEGDDKVKTVPTHGCARGLGGGRGQWSVGCGVVWCILSLHALRMYMALGEEERCCGGVGGFMYLSHKLWCVPVVCVCVWGGACVHWMYAYLYIL